MGSTIRMETVPAVLRECEVVTRGYMAVLCVYMYFRFDELH